MNHYEVLGVPQDASSDDIHHAWRVKTQLVHPDYHTGKSPDVKAAATSETRRANEAWEILGNPTSRQRYDASLSRATAGSSVQANQEQSRASTGSRASQSNPPPPRSDRPLVSSVCSRCKAIINRPEGTRRIVCSMCGEPTVYFFQGLGAPRARWFSGSPLVVKAMDSSYLWPAVLVVALVLAGLAMTQPAGSDVPFGILFGAALLMLVVTLLFVGWLFGPKSGPRP